MQGFTCCILYARTEKKVDIRALCVLYIDCELFIRKSCVLRIDTSLPLYIPYQRTKQTLHQVF